MRSPALPSPRHGLAALTAGALIASPLALGLASAPADADVSSRILTFPYTQNWSNADLITDNNDWSNVTGVQGYLGGGLTGATGTDPQTLTGETTDTNVLANSTASVNNGGVIEVQGDTIAIQGSGSASAPHVTFRLDLTGQTAVSFGFNARDLDASADNATQQIAVQYRVGDTGAFTNLPAGYIADATTASSATQLTARSVPLPAGVEGQSSVFVRVMTTNAVGNDELVGIDDVNITATAGTASLNVTNPGAQSSTIGRAITPLQLIASGGTPPYTVMATNLPAGLTFDGDTDTIFGTPNATGSRTVGLTVTDGAGGTDTDSFVWIITDAAAPTSIAAIQGTGASSPMDGTTVTTEGVVTGSYATGGLNGFYIQTPGADTADASDAIFVYGGTNGFTTYPAVGDSVEVTGEVDEFFGTTQMVTNDAGVVAVTPSLGTVTAKTQVPGTDCALPGTACLTGAALDQAREVAEGELFKPTAPWTVTDAYDGSPNPNTNGSNDGSFRGELAVAADSSQPLVAPTEVIDAQDTDAINARKSYNGAKRIILDDGSSWTYSTTSHQNDPFPWFTEDHSVRAGSAVTFVKPVIFTYGFNAWRILPQAQVTGDPTGTINFSQTRPAAPENVGGDVKLATFNVLNFFPTTGEEFVAMGGGRTCTYYDDRAGNHITNNRCNPDGPRGAADDANLKRQRDKIVAAITTADADIVSLEELENSVKFGKDRDFAITKLVDALNAEAGAGTWAAVPSPATLPTTAEQDVIRNGFIYQPASVDMVGASIVLSDQSGPGGAFQDAREPLAQAFKQDGTADADAFAVIVNHFKSKGSGNADPDGQGNATDQRVAQAHSLSAFADSFKTARGVSRVFLTGDFNAYSEEDPIQVLEAAGYTNLESTSNPDEETYNFDGLIGSLDHVLANDAALKDVNAVDIWDINGYESVYYEYSRFNSNVTNLYEVNPFRSSDHSPEIVGINNPDPTPVPTTVTGSADQIAYGTEGSVEVTVEPSSATGTVTVSQGAKELGSATLSSGTATIVLPAMSLSIGTHTLTLTYSGDARNEPSQGSVTVTVTKASPTVSVEVTPERVVVKGTKAQVLVTVTAEGLTPTGSVLVAVDGRSYWASLNDGTALLELKKFKKEGRYDATVSYFGDAFVRSGTAIVTIEVDGR